MERTGGGDESWVALELEGEGRGDRVVEDSMIYWEGKKTEFESWVHICT